MSITNNLDLILKLKLRLVFILKLFIESTYKKKITSKNGICRDLKSKIEESNLINILHILHLLPTKSLFHCFVSSRCIAITQNDSNVFVFTSVVGVKA